MAGWTERAHGAGEFVSAALKGGMDQTILASPERSWAQD